VTADECVEILDGRYRNIDPYRALDGAWRVRLDWHTPNGVEEITVAGDTLTAALRAAVDAKPPLPRIPRPPVVPTITVHRDGGSWRCNSDGAVWGRFSTRKAAEAKAAEVVESLTAAAEAWQQHYGARTRTGHGTDWLWSDEREAR
jgi:hypothetical protein